MRQHKYREAAAFLAELIEKSPDAGTMRLYAEALWFCRKSRKAEQLYKSLLEKNPQDIETLLLRAKIAASRGHTTKADAYLKDVISHDPLNPKGWIGYMEYLLEHRRWMVSDIGLHAVQLDPDIFRDDYGMYLHCICNSMNNFIFLDHKDEACIGRHAAMPYQVY